MNRKVKMTRSALHYWVTALYLISISCPVFGAQVPDQKLRMNNAPSYGSLSSTGNVSDPEPQKLCPGTCGKLRDPGCDIFGDEICYYCQNPDELSPTTQDELERKNAQRKATRKKHAEPFKCQNVPGCGLSKSMCRCLSPRTRERVDEQKRNTLDQRKKRELDRLAAAEEQVRASQPRRSTKRGGKSYAGGFDLSQIKLGAIIHRQRGKLNAQESGLSIYENILEAEANAAELELDWDELSKESSEKISHLATIYHHFEELLGVERFLEDTSEFKKLNDRMIQNYFRIVFLARWLAMILQHANDISDPNSQGHKERLLASFQIWLFYCSASAGRRDILYANYRKGFSNLNTDECKPFLVVGKGNPLNIIVDGDKSRVQGLLDPENLTDWKS